MSKFAIGDRVDKATSDREGGVVVAVFPTDDGNFRYAVDMEGYGALQFLTKKSWSFTSVRAKASEGHLIAWHLDALSGSHPPHLLSGVNRTSRLRPLTSEFDRCCRKKP
jgi:hypothetical protein